MGGAEVTGQEKARILRSFRGGKVYYRCAVCYMCVFLKDHVYQVICCDNILCVYQYG